MIVIVWYGACIAACVVLNSITWARVFFQSTFLVFNSRFDLLVAVIVFSRIIVLPCLYLSSFDMGSCIFGFGL